MKYAAIYIRVSTDEQVRHGYSLKEQEADLKRYAARRGYLVYDVYADEGVSARKRITRRHELQRLLTDIKNDRIDVVLVKCLDRWFRNVADFYEVQKILDAYHVGFECSQEDYNTTTTNGRLMLNLMLSIAQNESDQTSDRIKYIHNGLKRNKFEIGDKHPIGYKRINNRLVIDTEQRPIVEFIFSQRINGLSAQRIADLVFDKFHFSIQGQVVWRLLHNRTYIGERYGIADFCPAIIDEAMFLQVQTPLRQRKPRRQYVYLFAGKIICPGCGHVMTMHHDAKGNSYYCNAKYKRPVSRTDATRKHGHLQVRERDVEMFLLQNMQRLLAAYRVEWQTANQYRADAEHEKQHLRKKAERLKTLFIDGFMDHDEFKQKYQQVTEKMQQLENFSARRDEMPKPVLDVLSKENFADTYHALSQPKKRELWQSLIERIELGNTPVRRGIPYTDFKIIFCH